jgi:hypothetical protein
MESVDFLDDMLSDEEEQEGDEMEESDGFQKVRTGSMKNLAEYIASWLVVSGRPIDSGNNAEYSTKSCHHGRITVRLSWQFTRKPALIVFVVDGGKLMFEPRSFPEDVSIRTPANHA